ncbi:MAG: hypothetical protein M1834_005277 [Cirrosporium novae-zelandiae]|nr:MAG: hypothetical protein M1834_005277 [Cirrosporium novae-zelandiae]
MKTTVVVTTRNFGAEDAWNKALDVNDAAINWAIEAAQILVLRTFRRIAKGTLVINQPDRHKTEVFGLGGAPESSLRVTDERFWIRLMVFADLGITESYMLGEIACTDLTALFQIFIQNRDALSNGVTYASAVVSTVKSIARKTNTIPISKMNAVAHFFPRIRHIPVPSGLPRQQRGLTWRD